MMVMKMAFDQIAYKNEFNRQNYDRIGFRVPKGKKEMLQAYAERHGISVNELITRSVEEYTGIPLSKD